MKKFIKLKLLVITAVILLCAVSSVMADNSDVIISLQLDNPFMEINGVQAKIDDGQDTKPIIIDGRTLIPIRAVIENFNGRVEWDDSTKAVILTIKDDIIKLTLDSKIAYLNGEEQFLDVAPISVNGRTMLPIRFIAEGFNLGVAWNDESKTVSIIKSTFDESEYAALMNEIPPYSNSPSISVNNNTPFFKDYEIINASFEYYSDLDELGRCNVCFASIAEDLMPREDRKSISGVTPTGWINKSYDIIEGDYLYNRCHLIGFQLTGENDNELNLITGTRYLNIEGMLPFENLIADYIEKTGNRVIYRSTPVFSGNNLVADGVLLEAYSVEDNGQGIKFCTYCYNVQPHIKIDYLTGENNFIENIQSTTADISPDIDSIVYRTPTGKRYHFDMKCGGENSYEVSLNDAKSAGLTPCSKCTK